MKKEKIYKGLVYCSYMVMCFVVNAMHVYAGNWAENAGNWVTTQLVWIGLICIAVALITCLIKRNYIAALLTVIGGGVILIFIDDPMKVKDIGNTLYSIISGTSS